MTHSSEAGAAVYSPLTLKLYDWWVLGVSNRFAWQCSTNEVLQPFFNRHVGTRHLDVGVGTGFYLSNAQLKPETEVTLLDLNSSSLEAARVRLGRSNTRLLRHDILQPLPTGIATPHDSISLFYLLHCLPGNMQTKEQVFANLKPLLADNGVLFGATILGDDVGHNGFGRKLMAVYNKKGIFGNRNDTAQTLRAALARHFSEVTVEVRGKVALFTARKP
ncbi:MAG: methyltransferase [Pseudomonas sp.]